MQNKNQGFALITSLGLLLLVMTLVSAYFILSSIENETTAASVNSTTAFYAAEAGLNLRGQALRETFEGYQVPVGTSPSSSAPCQNGDDGTGDFACQSERFSGHTVTTYVQAGSPQIVTIPAGQRFAGLNAQDLPYTVRAEASSARSDGLPEAILTMQVNNRLVPLFQFAAFYNKDLEILNGPPLTVSGPIHVNGDLYLNTGSSQKDLGQITVSERSDSDQALYGDDGGKLYRGRKENDNCGGTVQVATVSGDANTLRELSCDGALRTEPSEAALSYWADTIFTDQPYVEVPEVGAFDPPWQTNAETLYWNKADLRVVLDVSDAANPVIEVRNKDNNNISGATTSLKACAAPTGATYTAVTSAGPIEMSNSFYNNRENRSNGADALNPGDNMTMLEVDVQGLLDCLVDSPPVMNAGAMGSKSINDTSDGGLVWYFTVEGPNADGLNSYGVRLWNGAVLEANSSGAPRIKGLTVVTDQAAYIQGDYNCRTGDGCSTASPDWRPAAVISDSLNILSNDWADTNLTNTFNTIDASAPAAVYTVVNAAFLSGTDTTGGPTSEGVSGQGNTAAPTEYNGGLENFPRFHENWQDISCPLVDGNPRCTLRYRGSLVSLTRPRHVDGLWSQTTYRPPARDWGYDEAFDNAFNLPPLTPRFNYLRQQLFQRDFER